MIDYNIWLQEAFCRIELLSPNTIFLLKDLFEGTKWNNLTYAERRELGRLFKNIILNNKFPSVTYIGKAQNGSAKYKIE